MKSAATRSSGMSSSPHRCTFNNEIYCLCVCVREREREKRDEKETHKHMVTSVPASNKTHSFIPLYPAYSSEGEGSSSSAMGGKHPKSTRAILGNFSNALYFSTALRVFLAVDLSCVVMYSFSCFTAFS